MWQRPRWGIRRASPHEAGGVLVLEDTFLRCAGVVVVADLTGQRRTFHTAAILRVNY